MTGAELKALRALVFGVIETLLPGVNRTTAWVQVIDADQMPAAGVSTPSVRTTRETHDGSVRDDITLMVVLKRFGTEGALENQLDDDLDLLNSAIIAAIEAASRDCELTETATRIDRQGDRPVGALTLQYAVTSWT
jgi:hypothetical protein